MLRSFALLLAASTALATGSVAVAAPGAAPVAAQARTTPLPAAPLAELIRPVDIPFEKFVMPNGLTVIVHTDRKAPIVAVSTWYDVGSKHEPTGKTGFAHLFEHLMFNGSENAPGDFFAPLREVGATDFNGTTSFDRTNYFETVPKAALERALFLESDRMGYLLGAITQGVLDEQRGVVQNEKRQGDNQPYGLVRYKMTEGLFPEGSPYHHSVIGSMADLDAASLEDVKTWFRSHYGPNNAVLVLAGDITAAEARPLVQKYFGKIPKGPESLRPKIAVPTLASAKAEVMKDRVAATRVMRMWAVPGMDSPDATALDVAAGALGGLDSSRLDNVLVRQEKLAVSVSASNQTLAQAGMFVISMDVRPGVDPKVAAQRLDQVVADFLRTGPTAEEVARVATVSVSGTVKGLESVGGFGGKAVALAQGELYMGDPDFFKKQLQQLAATTPASAKAAATKWLSRPVYALTVEPGARDAYEEAQAAPKVAEAPVAPTPAAAEGPAKGTRGQLPAVGQVEDLSFPAIQRSRLSNGIELVYAQRTAVPVTQVAVRFDAGAAADPAGKLGTQALTLALMDEGTTSRDSVALAEEQERLGSRIFSSSTPDVTYVGLGGPSANLGSSVALLADVVRNPAFAPAEVERLKAVQLARIAQEMTSPSGLAMRAVPPLLYGTQSPYAKLAAGSGDPEAVKALTRTDLAAFHRAWLRPDKAKIFITSDRPLAEVQAALEKGFGDWRATGQAGVKDFGKAPEQASPRIVLIDRPDSPQSLIYGAQLTPEKGTDDLLALNTANDALGGNFLSRINMDLREEKHWSYGAHGSVTQLPHAVSYAIVAPVQADRTGDSIAAVQKDVREFLTTNGMTQQEFDRTITGETRELTGRFETSDAVLDAMITNDLLGRPDDYYATITDRYRGFQLPQLNAAARKALDPNKFVYVVVGDASVVRPQLDSLGMPVEVVAAPSVGTTPGGK
ncbi:M16 family metallopeptidase [Sphingomonas sp. ac-8]|uniref:M16 family metallopeptidase n=1 Tax=Sphingomonas sp. ac-8 TaxID=3242977 RepID=UPI003A81127F